MDTWCSGEQTCHVNIFDFVQLTNECPSELNGYLRARYTCLQGMAIQLIYQTILLILHLISHQASLFCKKCYHLHCIGHSLNPLHVVGSLSIFICYSMYVHKNWLLSKNTNKSIDTDDDYSSNSKWRGISIKMLSCYSGSASSHLPMENISYAYWRSKCSGHIRRMFLTFTRVLCIDV